MHDINPKHLSRAANMLLVLNFVMTEEELVSPPLMYKSLFKKSWLLALDNASRLTSSF